jgi:hypothetical protein
MPPLPPLAGWAKARNSSEFFSVASPLPPHDFQHREKYNRDDRHQQSG